MLRAKIKWFRLGASGSFSISKKLSQFGLLGFLFGVPPETKGQVPNAVAETPFMAKIKAKSFELKLQLSLRDYLHMMEFCSNEPLTVAGLTAPFGLTLDDLAAVGIAADEASEFLLFGHVADALAQEFEPGDAIDCVDVALAAADLGFENAEPFIERGPYILADIFSR